MPVFDCGKGIVIRYDDEFARDVEEIARAAGIGGLNDALKLMCRDIESAPVIDGWSLSRVVAGVRLSKLEEYSIVLEIHKCLALARICFSVPMDVDGGSRCSEAFAEAWRCDG